MRLASEKPDGQLNCRTLQLVFLNLHSKNPQGEAAVAYRRRFKLCINEVVKKCDQRSRQEDQFGQSTKAVTVQTAVRTRTVENFFQKAFKQ